LASLKAVSTASPPPVEKKTWLRSPGARFAMRSAASMPEGCAYDQSGKNASSSACFAAAWAMRERPWPALTTNRPASPSM